MPLLSLVLTALAMSSAAQATEWWEGRFSSQMPNGTRCDLALQSKDPHQVALNVTYVDMSYGTFQGNILANVTAPIDFVDKDQLKTKKASSESSLSSLRFVTETTFQLRRTPIGLGIQFHRVVTQIEPGLIFDKKTQKTEDFNCLNVPKAQ